MWSFHYVTFRTWCCLAKNVFTNRSNKPTVKSIEIIISYAVVNKDIFTLNRDSLPPIKSGNRNNPYIENNPYIIHGPPLFDIRVIW